MPEKHALLSPSSAARWLKCPASVVMCKDIEEDQDDPSVKAANEGTAKHKLLEAVLRGDPWDCNDEFTAAAIMQMHEYVLTQVPDYKVEYRLPIGHMIGLEGETGSDDDKLWGTADVFWCCQASESEHYTVHIFDAKFGRVEVEPDSDQLRVYALGGLGLARQAGLTVGGCKLHIMQPFAQRRFKSVTISADELWNKYRPQVLQAARTALEVGALPMETARKWCVPGDKQCQYCKAGKKALCSAYMAKLSEPVFTPPTAAVSVGGVDMPTAPTDVSDLEVSYTYALQLEKWIKQVKDTYKAWLETHPTEGKAFEWGVTKAGNRTWAPKVDAKLLAALTGLQESTVVDLVSPAALEKLVKKTERQDVADVLKKLAKHTVKGADSFGVVPKKA